MAQEAVTPELALGIPREGERPRLFSALAHRDFRYLAAGNLAASMGHWSQSLGQGWLVYELTRSPFQLGLISFAQGVPMFVTSPVAGALADRLDRKWMVSASQMVMALSSLLLAMLVLTDAVRVWHLYCLSALSGVLFGVNSPPRQAMVFDLVGREDLRNAVALNSISQNSTRVLGPSLGAVFLGTVGVEGTFFLQSGSYWVALATILMIRSSSNAQRTPREPFLGSLADGVSYARRDRTITALLLISFISAVLGWAYMSLMPAYAGKVLGLGGTGFGLLMTASGGGALLGAFGLMALGNTTWQGKALLLALAVAGLGQVVLGSLETLSVIVLTVMALGFSSALLMALNGALVQMVVEDEYRGRVTALAFQVWGLVPMASLAAGAVAQQVGVQPVVLFLGALVTGLTVVVAAAYPQVRRL